MVPKFNHLRLMIDCVESSYSQISVLITSKKLNWS